MRDYNFLIPHNLVVLANISTEQIGLIQEKKNDKKIVKIEKILINFSIFLIHYNL